MRWRDRLSDHSRGTLLDGPRNNVERGAEFRNLPNAVIQCLLFLSYCDKYQSSVPEFEVCSLDVKIDVRQATVTFSSHLEQISDSYPRLSYSCAVEEGRILNRSIRANLVLPIAQAVIPGPDKYERKLRDRLGAFRSNTNEEYGITRCFREIPIDFLQDA